MVPSWEEGCESEREKRTADYFNSISMLYPGTERMRWRWTRRRRLAANRAQSKLHPNTAGKTPFLDSDVRRGHAHAYDGKKGVF